MYNKKIKKVGTKKINCGLIRIPKIAGRNAKNIYKVLFSEIEFKQRAKKIKYSENANDPLNIFKEVFNDTMISTNEINKNERLFNENNFLTILRKK